MPKKKKNMPALRFPEFSGEWEEKKFDDIFSFSTGKNIKQKEASPEFETPCVRYGELYHMYNEVINEVINKTNLPKEELSFSKGNEILMPSAGEDPLDIGSASALTIENVAIGRTINILRPKNESLYSEIFVSYYINQQLKRKIASLAKGVSISNVYNSDLKNLFINLPSLKEQKKIAQFLTTIDQKIQQLQQKKTLLEQYKKGLMQQIFSQKIRFKDEKGKAFPKWEKKEIGDVFDNYGGTALEKFVSSNSKFRFISIGNYSTKGKYIDNGQRIELNEKTKKKLLNKGNLVMVLNDKTKSGDIIGSTILIEQDNSYIYNQRSERLVCEKDINPIFAWFQLNLFSFRRNVFSISQGGTQIYVNFSSVKKLNLKIPCLEEQKKIAQCLTALDEKIESVALQLEKTKAYKKGLLQQMFV